MPNIFQQKEAVDAGTKALGDRELSEEYMQSPDVDTPSFRHQRAISTTADARKLMRRGYVENHATINFAKKFVNQIWTNLSIFCLFFFSPKSCLPTGKTIRNHVEEIALEVGQQWDWIWYREIVANAILIRNIDMRMEFATIKSNHSRRAWPTFHSDGKSDVRLRLRFQHDL